jgi:hypothetical protein
MVPNPALREKPRRPVTSTLGIFELGVVYGNQ